MSDYRDVPDEALHPNPYVAKALRDNTIRSALETGERHKAYELLRARRNAAKDPEERAAFDEVLSKRRSFVEPMQGAPTMFTFNTIGTRLSGESEKDADGTYIASLCFVVLFIPIFPLSSYLVRSAGGRSYQFFGRVPLGPGERTWRRTVAGLAAGVTAFGVLASAWTAHHESSHADVHAVNGLDIPVVASVCGREIKLPPGGHEALHDMPEGPCHFEAKAEDGTVLEALDADVPGGTDLVAYDVLGAALVYVEDVVYSDLPSHDADSEPTLLAGQSVLVRDRVDYVFTTPPQQIEVSDKYGSTTRTHADLAGPWRLAFVALLRAGRQEDARRIVLDVARAEPDVPEPMRTATALLGADKQDELLALAEARVQRAPRSVEAHRSLQDAYSHAGKRAEVVDRYAKAFAQDPSSASSAYLHARLQHRAEGLAVVEPLLTKHPDDTYLLRLAGYDLHQSRRHADALGVFERLRKVDTKAWQDGAFMHVEALAALGRVGDAALVWSALLEAPDHKVSPIEAIVYARLARLAGASASRPATAFLEAAQQASDTPDDVTTVFRGLVGDVAPEGAGDPLLAQAAALEFAVRHDRAKTVELAASFPEVATGSVDPASLLLACAELARTGGPVDGLVGALSQVSDDPAVVAAMRAFVVEGTSSPLLDEVPLELRAAFAAIRSRRAKLPAERKRLADEARALDVLHGAVTDSLDHWI